MVSSGALEGRRRRTDPRVPDDVSTKQRALDGSFPILNPNGKALGRRSLSPGVLRRMSDNAVGDCIGGSRNLCLNHVNNRFKQRFAPHVTAIAVRVSAVFCYMRFAFTFCQIFYTVKYQCCMLQFILDKIVHFPPFAALLFRVGKRRNGLCLNFCLLLLVS